jgi:hypothetical protein
MAVGEIYSRSLKKNSFDRQGEFQKKMARRFLERGKERSGRKGSPKEKWRDQKAVCLNVD